MKQPSHTLLVRTISAAVAIPVVLALLWRGGVVVAVGAGAFFAVALYEIVHTLRARDIRILWPVSLAIGLLLCTMAVAPGLHSTVIVGLLGCAVSGLAWRLIVRRTHLVGDLLATFVFSLYVGGAFACLLTLRGSAAMAMGLHPFALHVPSGMWWILVALFGTWSFDTGAYLVGRKLGRHKMAPTISPKKSWEGVAGGLLFAVPVIIFTLRAVHVAWQPAAFVGLAIAVAAILGDLIESIVKRWSGVKDSGHFMPGHGGLLDRIDSMILVAFVVYAVRLLIG